MGESGLTSQSRSRGLRNFFQNLYLVLFGVVVGIFVCELFARALYREPWYEQLITEQIEKTASADYNRQALHRSPYSKPKSAQIQRVLILGDSFTYGWGGA